MVKVRNSLVGQKFGNLTVLEQAEDYIVPKTGKRHARWKCLCDCTNTVYVCGSNLKSGSTKRCDECNKKDMSQSCSLRFKKYNRHETEGIIEKLYTSKGELFYVDACDYPMIKDICWHVHIQKIRHEDGTIGEYKYITGRDLKSGKDVVLSRYLMGIDDDDSVVIDHWNGNTFDNRRQNLRICTQAENCQNKRLSNLTSTKIKGVTYDKESNKYIARIGYKYRRYFLGRFDCLYDAAKAYNDKALELFGEFAKLNNLNAIMST